MRKIAAAAALIVVLSGCSGSVVSHAGRPAAPHATATVTASTVQPAVIADTSVPPGSQFCDRLKSAPDEAAYYASEVAYQARQAGGDAKAARSVVGLWITISCPGYAYLEQGS